MVKGVVFDVGYTLIDETRRWREWAEWLEVEPDELWSSMRRVIAEGGHHSEGLKRLKPGFDMNAAREEREHLDRRDEFLAVDMYPDVAPCVAHLKAAGLKTG